ncbi:MAG TPA: hypothetical protein VG963_08845 [Polyangiaceae bacterium]|nr:hypothetical protein [Polyangiaceae bacterium]
MRDPVPSNAWCSAIARAWLALAIALTGGCGSTNERASGSAAEQDAGRDAGRSATPDARAPSAKGDARGAADAPSTGVGTHADASGSGDCEQGFSELPNGQGGTNVEQVCYGSALGFDKARSLAAFQTTLYPVLRTHCAACHSTETHAQAPIHSDVDPALAHEYALTRVNFRQPADSKFVVRMGIDRHNCFGTSCKDASAQMLSAVQAWAQAVADMLPAAPRPVPEGQMIDEAQVTQWIAADRAALPAADAAFMQYTSLHELHNAGVSADELNVARVAVSKALNSTARWAPEIANPVDVNGKGIVYRFDIRDYWGYNKGVTKLHFGGSDDDLFFGSNKTDVDGNVVTSAVMNQRFNFAADVSQDPAFAQTIWKRVLDGNIEGAVSSGSIPANIAGFKPDYVEASQLVYTLTRPDVYNAIMVIPWYANELEDELGVVRDKGPESYQYMVAQEAITVDSRLFYRARTKSGGFYWKTFDIFTGQNDTAHPEKMRFPFWAHPIPKFIAGTGGGVTAQTLSFMATLAQPLKSQIDGNPDLTQSCEPQSNFGGDQFYNCRYYTGQDGLQQSAEESIWDLPNGLQGYALFGGFNQRRVDAFVNIVRDPRIQRNAPDQTLTKALGFAVPDLRLNQGGSCIGCHIDGLNRGNNDLRDWLETGNLPTGDTGADSWTSDETTKANVRTLYPPSSVMRPQMEDDRRVYLRAMAKIRSGMVLGDDKNVRVEPIVWSFEWAQKHYNYAATRSN